MTFFQIKKFQILLSTKVKNKIKKEIFMKTNHKIQNFCKTTISFYSNSEITFLTRKYVQKYVHTFWECDNDFDTPSYFFRPLGQLSHLRNNRRERRVEKIGKEGKEKEGDRGREILKERKTERKRKSKRQREGKREW